MSANRGAGKKRSKKKKGMLGNLKSAIVVRRKTKKKNSADRRLHEGGGKIDQRRTSLARQKSRQNTRSRHWQRRNLVQQKTESGSGKNTRDSQNRTLHAQKDANRNSRMKNEVIPQSVHKSEGVGTDPHGDP